MVVTCTVTGSVTFLYALYLQLGDLLSTVNDSVNHYLAISFSIQSTILSRFDIGKRNRCIHQRANAVAMPRQLINIYAKGLPNVMRTYSPIPHATFDIYI